MSEFSTYVASFGTVIGVIFSLSPIVSFIAVFKGKQSYTVIPELMFYINLINNEAWACYWYRNNNIPPIYNNVACSAISFVFSWLFLYFKSEGSTKAFLGYTFLLFDFILQAFFIFFQLISDIKIVSYVLIIINTLLYAAPGQKIIEVFRTGNYNLIPITSTICSSLCSFTWFLFGYLVKDTTCIIPNALGLVFAIIQTGTWFYFYCTAKPEDKHEEKEQGTPLKDIEEKV